MSSPEVTIHANLEGAEQVAAGFNQIGEAAGAMGSKVSSASRTMDVNWRSLATGAASLIANTVQLGDLMGRMVSGQMDVGRGAMMLAMNFLQLIPALTSVTAAFKGVAIAQGISQALSGPVGWAVLAGAAAAAAGVYALVSSIPSKQGGGEIFSTGPYLLHAGEYVLPRGSPTVNITINSAGSPRETGDAVVDALRRAGAI